MSARDRLIGWLVAVRDFVGDDRTKKAISNIKSALLLIFAVGAAFDTLWTDEFHALKEALGALAF